MPGPLCFIPYINKELLFVTAVLIRYGEFLAAFCSTWCKYSAAIGWGHSLTETVLVLSLPVGRLKCSFHRYVFLLFSVLFWESEGKGSFFFLNMQIASLFLSKVLSICLIALLLQSGKYFINYRTNRHLWFFVKTSRLAPASTWRASSISALISFM